MADTLTDADMNTVLTTEAFGHLACCDSGKPYILPLAYVFHDNILYGQTTEGKKTDILRANPLVCFQVQREINGTWQSVICWGMFEELDFEKLDKAEAIDITKRLTEKLGSIQNIVGITIPFSYSGQATPLSINGKKSTLFRIVITEKTGKAYGGGE